MIKNFKSEKGITGVDLTISIIIIMMFISIIASLSINVSTSLASKRRLDIATECITEIMEKLDELDYDLVEETIDENKEYKFITIKNIDNEAENITYNSDLEPSTFKNETAGILQKKSDYDILSVFLKVENYKPEGQTYDLVKKVTLKVTYKLNNENEEVEITRLKTRYNVDLEEPVTN